MVIATSRCISLVVLEKSCAVMAAMDGLPQGLFVPTRVRAGLG